MSDPRLAISNEQRRRALAARHRLTPDTATNDVHSITESLVALHSSDPATVHLACLARMVEPSISKVEAALYDERRIVRHHAMRRTIWVMAVDDARAAHAATTEKIAANERKRTLKAIENSTDIGDPAGWFDEATKEVIDLLVAEGSLSTREVGERLPHLSVPLEFGSEKHSATLNAHTKVLQGSGFDGDIVRGQPAGSWISSEYPWSAAESWLGQPISGLEKRQAAAHLVDRWLRSFGPGTEDDLVWWFGDTKTLIRNGLADCGAVEVDLEDGSTGWVARDDVDAILSIEEPDPWVRLLPGLDPTAMGWKQRDFYLDTEYLEPMFDRFGNIGPSIWADGRIVGGWIQRDDASITTELFVPLPKGSQRLLDDAIDQVQGAVGDVVVKPRFPARMQKALLA